MAVAWTKPVEIRRGDTTKRVEFPMPQNLPELKQAAQQYFGKGGEVVMKLHRGGVAPVTRQEHIGTLRDEDVIVISFDSIPQAAKADKGVFKSTQQQDYVGPSPTQLHAAAPQTHRPQTRERVPFTAVASYAIDYPKRELPGQGKRPYSAADGMFPYEPFTATTTYGDHYPARKDVPIQRPMTSALVGAPMPKTRFTAETSNQLDYVHHKAPPRPPLARDPAADRPMQDRPFNGETTYAAEYPNRRVKLRPTRRRQIPGTGALPARQGIDPPIFNGASEYRKEYQERQTPRREKIFLEPQLVDD